MDEGNGKYLLTKDNRLLVFPEDLHNIHLCNSGENKGRYKLYRGGNNFVGYVDEVKKISGNIVTDLLEFSDIVLTQKMIPVFVDEVSKKMVKKINKLGGIFRLYKLVGNGDYKLVWEDAKNRI